MSRLFKLQILYAEREFMAAQIKSANANGAALSKEVAHLRSQLGIAQGSSPQGHLQEALLSQSSSSGSISNDIFADANRYRVYVGFVSVTAKSFTALFVVKRRKDLTAT